jgi:hypothetical protein
MGFRPTRGNENKRRHPRESGGPFLDRNTMDSRFRWNEVTFESGRFANRPYQPDSRECCDFQESRRRRGISHCLENIQG